MLPGLSACSVAFHLELKAALMDRKFMPKGGVLGFGCQHVYPHTSEGLCDGVPALLKVGSLNHTLISLVCQHFTLPWEVSVIVQTFNPKS